jgi:hypothetical protein
MATKPCHRPSVFSSLAGKKSLASAFVAALQRKKLYTTKLRPNSLPNTDASGAIDPTS